MNRPYSQKNVINYYQSSQWLYRLFVYTPTTLGMHFGFWEKNTKNRQEAMLNQNKEIIRVGQIRRGMRVLDAGCGVGGTALYIARTTGASVWGISLDPKQIQLAKHYAQKRGVSTLTHFSVQDYTRTNFPDDFFDVVYGIESICHALSKIQFLREAHRILKQGGKLVILDGYVTHKPKNRYERDIVKAFTWSFALPDLITSSRMITDMKHAGFINIKSTSKTKEIYPTLAYFQRLGTYTQLICRLAQYIPVGSIRAIYRNYVAFQAAARGYEQGLAEYCQHYAEKYK